MKTNLFELFKAKGLNRSFANFYGTIGDLVVKNYKCY